MAEPIPVDGSGGVTAETEDSTAVNPGGVSAETERPTGDDAGDLPAESVEMVALKIDAQELLGPMMGRNGL